MIVVIDEGSSCLILFCYYGDIRYGVGEILLKFLLEMLFL